MVSALGIALEQGYPGKRVSKLLELYIALEDSDEVSACEMRVFVQREIFFISFNSIG